MLIFQGVRQNQPTNQPTHHFQAHRRPPLVIQDVASIERDLSRPTKPTQQGIHTKPAQQGAQVESCSKWGPNNSKIQEWLTGCQEEWFPKWSRLSQCMFFSEMFTQKLGEDCSTP